MNRATILVVEDEEIVSLDIIRTLEMLDYAPVGTVRTGDAAIEKARDCAPDIVLMDINIPGTMNGLGAAEIIRKDLDIPVIFVTSYADDAVIEKAKLVNPYGYVLKPFTERDLKVAIEIALSRKAAETPGRRGGLPVSPGGYATLPDIRTLLLEDFFNDIVLLLYNSTEVKEQAFTTFIEMNLETRNDLLFAYSISRAHRKFLPEIRQGKIRICRMKDGDISPLIKTLSEISGKSDNADPVPLRFIMDFSGRSDREDILAAVDQVLAIQKKGIPVCGIIALFVGTNDDDLVKALSRNIPKVIVTTSQGAVISCADHSFPLEHLSFLPQPVVDETIKKVLEPVILSLLRKPISGYDLLHEIQERYNVSIPQSRIYTLLYKLQKKGYLSVNASGKSKVYFPTETGKIYIRQKLDEFNSVYHHILSEILHRNAGTSVNTGKKEQY